MEEKIKKIKEELLKIKTENATRADSAKMYSLHVPLGTITLGNSPRSYIYDLRLVPLGNEKNTYCRLFSSGVLLRSFRDWGELATKYGYDMPSWSPVSIYDIVDSPFHYRLLVSRWKNLNLVERKNIIVGADASVLVVSNVPMEVANLERVQ